MSKLTKAIAIVSILFAGSSMAASCKNQPTVYHANTVKGNKEVTVCYLKESGHFQYEFGKIGQTPDKVIEGNDDTIVSFLGNGDISMAFNAGAFTYTVGQPLRSTPKLYVEKNHKTIATIELEGYGSTDNFEQYMDRD